MFSASLEVPDLRAVVVNRADVVGEMTGALAEDVRARTMRGEGVRGKLPTDMQATGQFVAAIGGRVTTDRNGVPSGVVTALGKRSAGEQAQIKVKAKRARERTRQLKAAAALGMALSSAARDSSSPAPPKIRLSRLRVRTVTDNASLAAILSTEPKDLRARNGGRGVYSVFGVRDSERTKLARIAGGSQVEFVSVGTLRLETAR